MRYSVVTRVPGPSWDGSRPMREQDGWDDHARFMDGLVEDGFIVLGGPLGDGTRFMHVVSAPTVDEVEARFADDPWTHAGLLTIASVEPWEILLGAEP